MQIGILRIGKVDAEVIDRIKENLNINLQNVKCEIISRTFPIPLEAFNKARQQYCSDIILSKLHDYAEKRETFDRILGIVDVDIYVPQLNFVFGEAECPGKTALISLWRLRPEFYGKTSNMELFVERSTKEALHELGHTFGLKHCLNPFCVMCFSNSIFETDRKQSLFCNKCHLKMETATRKNR